VREKEREKVSQREKEREREREKERGREREREKEREKERERERERFSICLFAFTCPQGKLNLKCSFGKERTHGAADDLVLPELRENIIQAYRAECVTTPRD
jgi:hypothetical protein